MQIAVDDLACRRAGRHVFAGLGFTLDAGEAITVTGRNGAGKTSLLAILAGLLRPEYGIVRATGLGGRTLAESLHFAGPRDGLKGSLTARENLVFAADLLGDPGLPPRAALDALGLAGALDLPVAYLSAGQRRRVALARLLVARRPLWLLDEPTLALDATSQAILLDLLRGHLAEGGLVVATTHVALDLAGARELSLSAAPATSPGGPAGPERAG